MWGGAQAGIQAPVLTDEHELFVMADFYFLRHYHGSSVVGCCDGPEAFLSRRVPV